MKKTVVSKSSAGNGASPKKPLGNSSPPPRRSSQEAITPFRSPSSSSVIISDQVDSIAALLKYAKKPLREIVESQDYQGALKQLSQKLSFEKELVNYPEFMQWMFQHDRITRGHWNFLLNEIVQGRLRELLNSSTGFGIVLWNQLCASLCRNADDLRSFLRDENLLTSFLWHASLEQRVTLFQVADFELTQRLFAHGARRLEIGHCIYSVLTNCFLHILNEHFYAVLSKYPAFLEFALTVNNPQDLDGFVRKYQDKVWFTKEYSQKEKAPRVADNKFSEDDKVRIIFCLNNIREDQEESEELSDQLLLTYFNLDSQDLRNAIFANPTLARRILQLGGSHALSVELQEDIFPLLRSMITSRQGGNEDFALYDHLFRLHEFLYYFIGVVELLFSQSQEEGNKPFLAELFEHFGPQLFSGITTRQLAELSKIRGNYEVIFGPFANGSESCGAKAEAYRVLEYVKEDDVHKRWVQTSTDTDKFVQEFRYGGTKHIDRWLLLLYCAWRGRLSEEDIFNKIIEQAESLCLDHFLRDIHGTQLDQLFLDKPVFAKKIIENTAVSARCKLSLMDFTHWDCCYLLAVLSDPDRHKAYGFTSRDFYQVADADQAERLFQSGAENQGFFAQLLMTKRMNDSARMFLVQTFLEAPSDIKSVLQRWLNITVRRLLMDYVEINTRALGSQPAQLGAILDGKVEANEALHSLAELNHYLQDREFYTENDFINALLNSRNVKELVRVALSTAPLCVQALINGGRLFSEDAEINAVAQAKPWAAKGEPHLQYTLEKSFEPEEAKLVALQNNLNARSKNAEVQRFLNAIWKVDCQFILSLLHEREDIREKIQKAKNEVKNGEALLSEIMSIAKDDMKTLNTVLNTNILARRLGLMRNPRWLKVALAYYLKGDYTNVGVFVASFLQLPRFRPTTSDLSPAFLKFEDVRTIFKIIVRDKPRQVLEYLIDLCHFQFERLNGDLRQQGRVDLVAIARELVSEGIEFNFKKLQADKISDVDDLHVQRFISLCVSAAGFLERNVLEAQFSQNTILRNQLCEWLLRYDVVTMPAEARPAFLRLQLILLRIFSHGCELPKNPAAEQLEGWQLSRRFVNDILWQLRTAPASAFESIQVRDFLDEQTLERLKHCEVCENLAHLLPSVVQSPRQPLPQSEVQGAALVFQ